MLFVYRGPGHYSSNVIIFVVVEAFRSKRESIIEDFC